MKPRTMCLVLTAFALAGCQREAPLTRTFTEADKEIVTKATGDLQDAKAIAAIDASTQFGLDLLKELERQGGNQCISPASLQMCFGMLYEGAQGTTKSAMKKALALGTLEPKDVTAANKSLLDLIGHSPGPRVTIANSLWIDNDITINAPFQSTAQKSYAADVMHTDLDDATVVSDINDWVDKKTYGKIDRIFDKLSTYSRVVLANAIHFDAKWKTPFKKDETHPGAFTLADGTKIEVPRMSAIANVIAFQGEGFAAATLPYELDRYSMVILLPDKGESTSSLLRSLKPAVFRDILTKSKTAAMPLGIPKWTSEFSVDLKPPLQALGMGEAFELPADFRGISPLKPLYIGQAAHKTFIRVDEAGTEAAAATAIEPKAASAFPTEFIVDHPFLFAIIEPASASLLFLGRVEDPRS